MNINLSENEITCVPPLLFKGNIGVSMVEFSYNKITALHPNLLRNLTTLSMANFISNKIEYIPNFDLRHTGIFGMGSIWLSLMSNPINAVDPEFLKTLFYSRQSGGMGMGPINIMYLPESNMTSCFDFEKYPDTNVAFNMMSQRWVQSDATLRYRTNCYKNWNADMAANKLVTCGGCD
jgi:hypothetical protein